MTHSYEAVREGSAVPDAEVPDSKAAGRARARERAPRTAPASLKAATERARLTGVFLASMAGKPGSLVHSQPPTFAQAYDRHRECAGYFGAPVLRWLRLAWGYAHLAAVKPALNLAEWVTESPPRAFVTAVLFTAIWFWS